MARTIEQSAEFPGVTPEELFDVYTDSGRHAAAIGATAEISHQVGARFSLFGGGIRGKNLFIVPKRMVVQSWRAQPWQESDPDSILVLMFSSGAAGARINLAQSNVPDHAYEIIRDGWTRNYWEPWQKRFARR